MLGVNFGVAIDFTGARDEHTCALGTGEAQAIVHPQRTHFQGLNGDFEIVDWTGRRCKMQDVVEVTFDVDELTHIVVVKLKAVESGKVLDVAKVTCNQVVHPDDMVPFGHETVAEVRPQKARGSCDEDALHPGFWVALRPIEVYSQPCSAISWTS